MTETFGLVYRSLLAVENLSTVIQERIFQYASKLKDYELLAALARHQNLHPEIESRFANVPHAVVKAAWAARPSRTDEELTALVENETRVKVLTALASRDDTPQKVFSLIATTKGQAPLIALASNNVVDVETRVAAIAQYAALVDANIVKIPPNVIALISSDDRLATAVATRTNNPLLALAALRSGALEDEFQNRAVYLAVEHMTKMVKLFLLEKNDRYSMMSYAVRECIRELTEVLESNQLSSQSVELISNTTEILATVVVHHPSLEGVVDSFLKVANNTAETFVVAARRASSSAELDKIIQTIGSDRSKYASPAATLCAVAQNEHCTAAIIRKMFDMRVAHWGTLRAMATTVTNRTSIAALILWAPYLNVDRILTKSGDPVGTLSKVLEIACTYDTTIHTEILQSKYMGREMICKLPIQSFFPNNCSMEMTTQLAAMLTERINEPATWEVLEAVGKEFTGSVDELLKIATIV